MSASVSTPGSASPLFRFEGAIPPRRIPLTYRIALALTAFAMILLPLVYVAIIGAAAYGVYLWAIHGLFLFSSSGAGLIKIAAYIAPIFAGATLILFMVKPLFARPAKKAEPFTLDLAHYPELRTLIETICVKVGAPMPVRVDIDCQVNASAGLRRGLLSLGRRDLVLTIGLPLVNGLTTRQVAGVLAHEFGHFAQGAGMAFTYIIRSINGWFARVVFERDHWDETLASWTQGGDFRVQLVVSLARGAVWLSRQVLHGLMIVGHAITCLQLRQMEYDADYYETHLVGSEEFAATGREISRLGFAANAAFNDLGELWQKRQLVDDFPDFVVTKRTLFATDELAKIDQHGTDTKTRWLDTHPCNEARNLAAARLALPGILHTEAPATALFPDLPDLARAATRHFYRAQLRLEIDASSFMSTEEARRSAAEVAAGDAARTRLAGTVLDLTRPIVWREEEFSPPGDLSTDSLHTMLTEKRAAIDQQLPSAAQESTAYSNILEQVLLSEQAHALLSVGAKITPRTFKLSKSDLDESTSKLAETTHQLTLKTADLRPFESLVHGWIVLIGQAARAEATRGHFSPANAEEVIRLTSSLAALQPWFLAFPRWHRQHTVLNVFFANVKSFSENPSFVARLQALFDEATNVGETAVKMIGDAPYPVTSASPSTSAANLLRNALEGVEGANRLVAVIETVAKSYFRIVGRIVAIGEELEKSLCLAASTPAPTPSRPS